MYMCIVLQVKGLIILQGRKGIHKTLSDKVSKKHYPRIVIVSGYKRHFPHELAILSKSATQYVIQSPEKNAFKNISF